MVRKLTVGLGAVFIALSMAACEGPAGPAGTAGAAGAAGPQGPAGPQGVAGQNALNTCSQCHASDARLVAIERQFQNSRHWLTTTFDRNTGVCVQCHTHQGFIAVAVEGGALPGTVNNPAPINCRTCHQIHTTFTAADLARTTNAPVNVLVGGTVNLGGDGNLCSNCHQARDFSPMPAIGGSPVTITNFRWGPHYGAQANVMGTTGFFHFTGTRSYPTGPMSHGDAGCQTCHMVPAVGNQAGGHTWRLRHGSANTALITACTQCHATATTFDRFGVQTQTASQMAELKALLQAAGIARDDGYAIPGTFDADVAAAFINYRLLYFDGSKGIHHPEYVDAVLTNTIAMLKAR
jgi:hypothetical protein